MVAFKKTRELLSTEALLVHFHPEAPVFLTTDASAVGIGGSLNQLVRGVAVPLGFFAQKLTSTQQRYSTFGRDLLAIHGSIQHFHHLLEGRDFYVLTDHKPLQYAFSRNSQQLSPREIRQLDFISQFTTDIRYLPGPENEVADALSRIEVDEISLPRPTSDEVPPVAEIDFERMAFKQGQDSDLQRALTARTTGLCLRRIPASYGGNSSSQTSRRASSELT